MNPSAFVPATTASPATTLAPMASLPPLAPPPPLRLPSSLSPGAPVRSVPPVAPPGSIAERLTGMTMAHAPTMPSVAAGRQPPARAPVQGPAAERVPEIARAPWAEARAAAMPPAPTSRPQPRPSAPPPTPARTPPAPAPAPPRPRTAPYTPPGWPAGLVYEPGREGGDREPRPAPTARRGSERALEIEPPRTRPAPPPLHPPAPHPGRPPRTSTEGESSAGKIVLWAMALLLVLIKGCEGCGASSRRDRNLWPTPRGPSDTPRPALPPLSVQERVRLEQLRRDDLHGEPLTAAERRELLELERRDAANRRGR